MVSQTDFKSVNLLFFEDADLGGHVKTRNEPPDRVQRRNITQRGADTDYRVDVDLSTCVHGYLDPTSKKYASLVILEAQFAFVGKGTARFQWADMSLQFSDTAGEASTPDIVSWAPFRFQEESDPTTIDVEKEKLASANASGGFPGGSAGVNASISKKTNFQKRYFDRGTAGRYYNTKADTYDGVWWTLQESLNPEQKDGIRVNCLFAVLIQRASKAPFTGDFQLGIEAGIWHKIKEKWQTIRCKAMPDDPINFDPAAKPQGKVDDIDANNLGKYMGQEKLTELVDLLNPAQPAE